MSAPTKPESDDEPDDPVEKMIQKTGCLEKHYTVQDCMMEHNDWRKCQKEVQDFKQCMADYTRSKHPHPGKQS